MQKTFYLFLSIILGLLACNPQTDSQQKAEDELNKLEAFVQENYPDAQKTDSGIYIYWEENGTGNKVQAGDYVNVKYTGKFLDGTIFDASSYHNGTFQFQVGTGGVISAWDEALQLCHAGDKIILITPSTMAYGAYGSGAIPGYTSLLFEIEVLEILK